jgi:L-ascorbate metabolism protein UlaG (beta-lactamase superfamily)
MTPPPSDHFNGKTFFQSHHNHAVRRLDFWRWRLTAKPTPWPKEPAFAPQPPPPAPRANQIVATWIGQATFLLQTTRGTFLTDPVFSERASPVAWAGPRRAHPPGVALAALPPLDAILLSHDHYDHCDVASLRELARRHRRAAFIAPLRHADLLAEAGVEASRAFELDWWQTHRMRDVAITFTPTKHWSNRLGTPRNHRLWGGFFLHLGGGAADSSLPPPRRIWFVGDTGYDAAIFREVAQRCGEPDLALVPIGAYEPRWFMRPMHMNPAEALQLHRDVGARLSLAMHWGTFQLSDEGRDDPVRALEAARRAAGLADDAFRIVAPGESAVV